MKGNSARFSYPTKLACLVPVIMATTACQGTFKTHVRPSENFSPWGTVDQCEQEYTGGVCNQIEHAEAWIRVYRKAGANPSNLRAGIAAAALPLAGVATFYGMTGHGSADRIARLSLGGATGYGYGTFFGSKGKQAVYYEGARAMVCIQLATAPALVKKSDLEIIDQQLEVLDRALKTIAGYPALDADQLSAVASATAIQSAARDLTAFVETAPLTLHSRITSVSVAVDKILADNEPTLESLAALTNGLKGLSRSFGGTTPPAAAPKSDGGQIFGDDPLEAAFLEMRSSAEAIRAHLVRYENARQGFAQVELCNPLAMAMKFIVDPADAAISVAVGAKREVEITDSSGFPSVQVTGSNRDAIEASPLEVRGGKLVLTLSGMKATGADGPKVEIRNASGTQVHSVQVLVAEPEKKPDEKPPVKDPPKDPPSAAAPRNDIEKEIFKDPAKILLLQCALGLQGKDTDCKVGDVTRAAIVAAGHADGAVDQALSDLADKQEVAHDCAAADPSCVSESPGGTQ